VTTRRCILTLLILLAGWSGPARSLPRTYLALSGGANVLNTDLNGSVVKERVVGHFEIGVGSHITDRTLLELSFAVMGSQEDPDATAIYDVHELLLPDTEKAYRVEVNPLMMRLRHSRSGMRQGYIKPEFSLGLGVYSVTRWLRNIYGVPPVPTSQLLPAVEAGASMLMILGDNFAGTLGARYTIMQRRGISQGTEHFDGFSVLLGFRFFLNSPADELEPDDGDDDAAEKPGKKQ
jgi:hypothetical protein